MSRKQILSWTVLVALVLLFTACHTAQDETQTRPDTHQMQQMLEMTNKQLLAREEQMIDDFLVRFGWQMEESGSGLRYKIQEQGTGPMASHESNVTLAYDVYLLNGDPVYSSNEDGPLQFRVGRGGAVSGIDEGVRLLRQGAKATFILPFHLAHGIPGDGDRIPGRTTIVYQVELINIF